jgi:hypothetical protein
MASLSWKSSKGALPIAVAVGATGAERKGVVYAAEDFHHAEGAKDLYGVDHSKERSLEPPPGCQFEPVVAGKTGGKGRDVVAIVGPSGAGKSYVMRMMAENYRRQFPQRPRFLLSSLAKDETLDAVPLTRVDHDVLAAKPPEDIDDWDDSLVIIDDVEGFPKPKREVVQALQDLIATQGRHSRTTLLRAQHVLDDRVINRYLLHEATSFIFFPAASGSIVPMLKKYAGLTKARAEEVSALKERWVLVHHTAPKYILTPHSVFIL